MLCATVVASPISASSGVPVQTWIVTHCDHLFKQMQHPVVFRIPMPRQPRFSMCIWRSKFPMRDAMLSSKRCDFHSTIRSPISHGGVNFQASIHAVVMCALLLRDSKEQVLQHKNHDCNHASGCCRLGLLPQRLALSCHHGHCQHAYWCMWKT